MWTTDSVALVLDRDLVSRQEACDVDEGAARQHDRAVSLHPRGYCGAQRKLHVGRGQPQLVAGGLEQDPRQDLDRRATRDGSTHEPEALHEVVLRARNPQLGTDCDVALNHLRMLVAVIGSVDDGEDVPLTRSPTADLVWRFIVDDPEGSTAGKRQRTCFTRAVSSCTRLYTDLSSRMRREILDVAWITVVWSRPPNSLPIFGSEESVSSRERYIATCRG